MAERLRDKDGDIWERQPNGQCKLITSYDTPAAVGLVHTMELLSASYGPLEALMPADDSASLSDFIRELRELCDRWANKLGA